MPVTRILVLNAGSSSFKLKVFACPSDGAPPLDMPVPLWEADVDATSTSVDDMLQQVPGHIDMVGHRIVHAGVRRRSTSTMLLDPAALHDIETAREFAPEHSGRVLEGIAAAQARYPAATQVGVLDHAIADAAPLELQLIPGPYAWYAERGLRRIGFHGISHRDVAERMSGLLGRSDARIVSIHLGSGCSVAAIRGTTIIDSSMGLTPMDGLMMAQRCGSIDPGVIFHLMRSGTAANALERELNEASGLSGLSGVSSDIREVIAQMDQGNRQASIAYACYVANLAKHVGSMAASLEGCDAVGWTGRIGEHLVRLRHDLALRLTYLGITIDGSSNEEVAEHDRRISSEQADVATFVLTTREEWSIARSAAALRGTLRLGQESL